MRKSPLGARSRASVAFDYLLSGETGRHPRTSGMADLGPHALDIGLLRHETGQHMHLFVRAPDAASCVQGATISGGQIVAKMLKQEGVQHIFTIPVATS